MHDDLKQTIQKHNLKQFPDKFDEPVYPEAFSGSLGERINMKNVIIVCGLNGAGKSTLGKALAEKLNYRFIDIEDIYFPKDNPRVYVFKSPTF